MSFPKLLKNRIRSNEPLAGHTTFRIGGKARYWYEPRTLEELSYFLKNPCIDLPFFVIGAGSNLLVRDGLIKKVFLHLKGRDFNKIEVSRTRVKVGSGVLLSKLISCLVAKDLGGYEFLAGIPGTIGGALVMNTGARTNFDSKESYKEMKDIVLQVEVLDKSGRYFKLKKKDLGFSYRKSSLKPYIICSATLKLRKDDRAIVRQRVKDIMKNRLERQDWQYPSAGSFFKNPGKGFSAGRLIDLCDLKGFRVAGAQVSEKHANFIINKDRAKYTDVIQLAQRVIKKVHNRYKIKLIPEVEVVC